MRTLQHHRNHQDLAYTTLAGLMLAALFAATPVRADPVGSSIEYRRLQQVDNSGHVRVDGLDIALEQRFAATGQSGSMNFRAAPAGKSASPFAKSGGLSPPSWTSIGPSSIGGRVRALAPHPSTAGRMLAGGVSGGLFRRASASAPWQAINDFLPNMSITCLLHDPSNPNTVYACTGEGPYNPATGGRNVDAVRGAGILRSNDGGDSWTRMVSTDPRTAPEDGAWNYVNRVAIRPLNPNIILAATHKGLHRSVDAGFSWSLVYGALPDGAGGQSTTVFRIINDVRFDPNDGNKALTGEQPHLDATGTLQGGAVAYTNDGGATFTRLPLSGSDRVEVAPASGVPGLWFALVNANGGELWRIQNNGTAWTATKASTPANLGADGWYSMALWVSPDGTRVFVGGAQTRFSVDGGASFGAPIASIPVRSHSFVADPQFASNGTIYVGTDAGVFIASGANVAPSAGPAFAASNDGLAITQFNGADGSAALGGRIIGGTQSLGTYTWTGSTWIKTFGGDGGRSAVDPVDSQVMYGSTPFLGIFRSVDAGASADFICAGITDANCNNNNPNAHSNFLAPIAVDPSNGLRMFAGGESLWRTDNARAATPAWSVVKAPASVSPTSPTGHYISAVAIARANPDMVWVGLNDGRVFKTANATAATPAWSDALTFDGLDSVPRRMVTRILVDDENTSRVYVTFGGYSTNNLIVTESGGVTWTNLHPGTGLLPAAPIRSIARHPTRANLLYVGTEVGVFASENGGLTWSTTTEGPGSVPVEKVFWLDSATLIAATHGRGMFRATIDVPSSIGTVQFQRTVFNAVEGSAATITVTRLGGASGAAQVNYALENGNAIVGSDVTATSGTLSWANGDASPRTISFNVANDPLEGMESFFARLSSPVGVVLGDPRLSTVQILDPLEGAPSWLTQSASSNAAWAEATDDKFEGAKSLRSGAIGASQRSDVEVYAAFPAGTVAFARRVSSRPGSHYLRFSIDSVVMGTWSGDVPWEVVSYPITAGVHTLKWTYSKDAQSAQGSDAAWIDAITTTKRFNPTGDDDNDSLPNAIEFREGRNPDVKDNDIFTNSRLFAMQQYRDILSREGEEAGIQGWVNALNAGSINRTTAVQIFIESPEFLNVVAPVARLYFAYFLRVPDYAGLIGWVGALKSGWTLPQVSNQFAASAEFQNLYGSLTNGQFVNLAYQNVLGRPADLPGLTYWVSQLDLGLLTRGEVMLGLSESTEYKNAMANKVTVTASYVGLLRRAPDPAGFTGWVAILNSGSSVSALINGIINSGEYRARFLP